MNAGTFNKPEMDEKKKDCRWNEYSNDAADLAVYSTIDDVKVTDIPDAGLYDVVETGFCKDSLKTDSNTTSSPNLDVQEKNVLKSKSNHSKRKTERLTQQPKQNSWKVITLIMMIILFIFIAALAGGVFVLYYLEVSQLKSKIAALESDLNITSGATQQILHQHMNDLQRQLGKFNITINSKLKSPTSSTYWTLKDEIMILNSTFMTIIENFSKAQENRFLLLNLTLTKLAANWSNAQTSNQKLIADIQSNHSILESTIFYNYSGLQNEVLFLISKLEANLSDVLTYKNELFNYVTSDYLLLKESVNSTLSKLQNEIVILNSVQMEQTNFSNTLSFKLNETLNYIHSNHSLIKSASYNYFSLQNDVYSLNSTLEMVSAYLNETVLSNLILNSSLHLTLSNLRNEILEVQSNCSLMKSVNYNHFSLQNEVHSLNSTLEMVRAYLNETLVFNEKINASVNDIARNSLILKTSINLTLSTLPKEILEIRSELQEQADLSDEKIFGLNNSFNDLHNDHLFLRRSINTTCSNIQNEIDWLNFTLMELIANLDLTQMFSEGNDTNNNNQKLLEISTLAQSVPFVSSCEDIINLSSNPPSGYYFIRLSNGSSVEVYCDMTMTCNNITGGWMRIAKLNKEDGVAQCFEGLEHNDINRSTCSLERSGAGCSHTYFSVLNIQYSHICGMVDAYNTNSYSLAGFKSWRSINNNYVDGVSITYGGNYSRKLIWTFVARRQYYYYFDTCDYSIPNFARNFYSCLKTDFGYAIQCQYNTCSPYFSRTLTDSTSEDIETRVCRDGNYGNENIILNDVEIYVQ